MFGNSRWEKGLSRKDYEKMEENDKSFIDEWVGYVGFYVPVELYRDKALRPLDREVYLWLNNLSTKKGYSWISNIELSKALRVSNKTIQECINKLERLDYIKKKTFIRNGKKHRIIYTKQKIAEEKLNESLKNRKPPKEVTDEEIRISEYDWL